MATHGWPFCFTTAASRNAVIFGSAVDLSFFFSPLDDDSFLRHYVGNPQSLGAVADLFEDAFPNWPEADLVLLGVPEDRASVAPRGAALAPNKIREYLYTLATPTQTVKVADLGNLNYRDDIDEVYTALAYVLAELLRASKTVIILGGAQDIAYGQYLAYQELETNIEYVSIDARPDMLDAEIALTNRSYNSQVFMHAPNYLYHFACLGTQGYYITETERKTLKAMNFENIRLGDLHQNIRLAEPHLRQANMVSFDMGAIRQADAPAASQPSPAGLSVDEACQLTRFAGMGYRTSSLSICEVNARQDEQFGYATSHLAALLAWHFIEGYYNRQHDQPKADRSNLQPYRVTMHGTLREIMFYRSESTGRWWMEVPSPQVLRGRKGISLLLPCAEDDYTTALKNEIPERWWMAHYRFQ